MYGAPPPPPRSPRRRAAPPTSAAAKVQELEDDVRDSRSPVRQTSGPAVPSLVSHLLKNPLALFTDHQRCFDFVAGLLLLWECLLCFGIVRFVRYTDIDFSTYLQQAQAFLDGERDYSLMTGESGPAYYPALHIYAYSALSYLTEGGKHLERAQWAFAGVYLATLAIVMFGIYRRNKAIPPYALIPLTLSKRLHSIYMLRMFNDGLVMLFVHGAIALYMVPTGGNSQSARRAMERRWMFGTVLLSCALSIKMSTLLFLPALFYLLFTFHSPLSLLSHLVLLLGPLTLFSLPFTLPSQSHTITYLRQAFDFGRAFDWRYTMNWRWLGQEAFENPRWGSVLLCAHAAGLTAWALKWAQEDGGVARLLRRGLEKPGRKAGLTALAPNRIPTMFFLSNLTGILCARSLHPQFYAWFAWSLPWLVLGGVEGEGSLNGMQGVLLLGLIDIGMSAWPSTVNSSLGLVLALLVVLMRSYYVESPVTSTAHAEWVVPVEWEGEREKRE
ncbi:hypothetical protein Rhopal_007815-T1 [Rhodotorula paludigena]|uniref:Dol-P-Man:Man(5)GlcNAc(2)-PP-Dol alpha-1,3-mannosyltransferase n=1 Tax=Rhodotorula paludigena TaxID=86838 RepID=A0AAV5GXP4_9BASI|nr:hypothetical protein Rhopal_007815-T1 [Rhodotorula paludigena]